MSNHLKGLSNTELYRKHRSMIDRCYNEKNKSFPDYGGRGITVCNKWKNDFLSFYDWAISHGYKEGLTIDRIDVNGNYCPENCCFITNAEQQRNKRNNVFIERNGKRILLVDLAKELGISERAVKQRIAKNKDVFAPKYKWERMVIRDDGVIYKSIREAAKCNNVVPSRISAVCRGERKRTANHVFHYYEEAEAALERMGEDGNKSRTS